MAKLLLRIAINAIAMGIAASTVPGIIVTGEMPALFLAAIVFGLVNAVLRPIVILLTLPINILTLGLFTLVINALMLLATGKITGILLFDGGFTSAFLGALVVSVVSIVLSWFVGSKK